MAKRHRKPDGIQGHARFEGPRQLRIGDEIIEAGQVFINVGARAHVPQLRGIDQVHYVTNSSKMDVDYLPEHLIIVGGSYVGLEFAQISLLWQRTYDRRDGTRA